MLYANIQGAQMDRVTLNCHFVNVEDIVFEDFKNVQLQKEFNPNNLFRLDLKNNGSQMLSILSDTFLESGRDVLYCLLNQVSQSEFMQFCFELMPSTPEWYSGFLV